MESNSRMPKSCSFTHEKITIRYVDGEEETAEMALDDPLWEKVTSVVEKFCDEMGWDFLYCESFTFGGITREN